MTNKKKKLNNKPLVSVETEQPKPEVEKINFVPYYVEQYLADKRREEREEE